MSFETEVTIWTIRIALICMACTFAIRVCRIGKLEPKDEDDKPNFWMEIAKSMWLIGSLFSLLHALAAMGFYHQFRHDLAFEDTARKTETLLGVRAGFGIWFNYLFVTVWLLDAFWWVATPRHYTLRSRWIGISVYVFLAFIAINGAIIFETGFVRWVSLTAMAILIGLYFEVRRRKQTDIGI